MVGGFFGSGPTVEVIAKKSQVGALLTCYRFMSEDRRGVGLRAKGQSNELGAPGFAGGPAPVLICIGTSWLVI